MKATRSRCMAMCAIMLTVMSQALAQTPGNHVFSGAEAGNFGTVDLPTPGGQSWSTDRTASPGYFSAVGSATYTRAADANANVDGYVKYYANNAPAAAFNFPVGTGSDLRNLNISGTIPATGVFATAWIVGDPSNNTDPTAPNAGTHATSAVGTGISAVSKAGMWDWQDVSGNASGMTVTASIPDMTTFAAAAALRLVGWNGTQWVNLSTSGASGNTENSTLSGTMIDGISAIGIGTLTPLPVTLISFNATMEQTTTLLRWRTAMEINSRNFEIERAADGKNWQKIGERRAQKESSVVTSYNFTDSAPLLGPNYYRLRMVDLDDTFAYSRIEVVHRGEAGPASVYPNPVSSILYIKGIEASKVREIALANARGEIVMRCNTISQDGIAVDKFSPGLYFLQVTAEEGTRSSYKLVVEK